MKKTLLIIALFVTANLSAANAWYWGTVKQVITAGPSGNFYVYLDNVDVKTHCVADRILVQLSNIGEERGKLTFTMAMTAMTTGKDLGIVIDMPTTENSEVCYLSASASQGAGIR